jgi:hypothetical protein
MMYLGLGRHRPQPWIGLERLNMKHDSDKTHHINAVKGLLAVGRTAQAIEQPS